jgi:adenylyltransferase/sulfurtransferase
VVDDDNVDLTNIHRQALYEESDAQASKPKVEAAAEHLQNINHQVELETVLARVDRSNIECLADDVGLILDGTDNFATRFLINDYAVKHDKPWIFAGVIGAEAQVMTIVPSQTPCLRCVMDVPPPPCSEEDCRTFGVLGAAVAAAGSLQACEAMKVLTGSLPQISPYLVKFDLWTNTMQRIDLRKLDATDCPCCKQREFEFLEP